MTDLEPPTADSVDLFYADIKTLNERIWEKRALRSAVDNWLANFADRDGVLHDKIRLHALYLLSRFMYFGMREISGLLHALYRDLYKYPIIANIRRAANDTTDLEALNRSFELAKQRTRFLGIGNPAESGTHLLYRFRQENRLQKELFISAHEIFQRNDNNSLELKSLEIGRYVFIDDFCGTGEQAKRYSRTVIHDIKQLAKSAGSSVRVAYYVLVSTKAGLDQVKAETQFDDVEAVLVLDDSYKCFGSDSRYFQRAPIGISLAFAKALAVVYGDQLLPRHPLGYLDSQLLVGFTHNTPDNTLPIIWFDEPTGRTWEPIFRRYPKIDKSGTL